MHPTPIYPEQPETLHAWATALLCYRAAHPERHTTPEGAAIPYSATTAALYALIANMDAPPIFDTTAEDLNQGAREYAHALSAEHVAALDAHLTHFATWAHATGLLDGAAPQRAHLSLIRTR